MDERELVGLVYRADWTRLALTGTVRGTGQFPETSWDGGSWPGSPFGAGPDGSSPHAEPTQPADWLTATAERPGDVCALSVAPGRRYRLARGDGSRVLGCDGERVWQWLADVPPGAAIKFERRPQPPVAWLLAPAWLLIGGWLAIEGETEVAGRPGIVVTGAAPAARLRRPDAAALLSWGLMSRPERVTAVIDAELGIVLRRELRDAEGGVTATEFTAVTVGDVVDPVRFDPVADSFFGDGQATGEGSARATPEQAGREALKLAGGLAAGGLGAAIKYSPKRQPDPFATATAEGPDDVMPEDEPLPGWALAGAGGERVPVSDEVLELLYRGGVELAPFSGRLLEWIDYEVMGREMIGAVPEPARRAGFGGVGFLLDAMLDAVAGSGAIQHAVYSVRVGAWDRYRVDRVFRRSAARTRPARPRRGKRDAVTTVCDGERTFRVYEDQVRVEPAGALDSRAPGDLPWLVSGSWLLQYQLSGGDPVEVDGRPGYRVVATAGDGPAASTPMSRVPDWWLPTVAIVDAASGRLLRLTLYCGGRIASRAELRSVADGGSSDFEFSPPDGLPVEDEAEFDLRQEVVDAVKEQLEEKVAAVRGFLGSFLGGSR